MDKQLVMPESLILLHPQYLNNPRGVERWYNLGFADADEDIKESTEDFSSLISAKNVQSL